MKRVLLIVALVSLVVPVYAVENIIAFADIEKIFEAYPKTEQARDQLEEMNDEYEEESQRLKTEYNKLIVKLEELDEESRNTALSEESRDQKRNEWIELDIEREDLKSRIERADRLHMKRLEERVMRVQKDIYEEIVEQVNLFAEKKGYAAVIDSSAKSVVGANLILYTAPQVDITEELVASFDKGEGQ